VRTETSILLPSATVDLFLKDKATMEAAKALEGDWRFARVTVRVLEGNVENAIEFYRETQSPDIVMIETDVTDDSFIGRLGELSGHCKESTSAVIIGPVNDVNLYRKLTAMGVSDYLVRPVPMDTLADVIAQNLVEKLGTAGSRLIAVAGAKGGVGASSLSQAIAWAASERLGQKTLLLDGAGAWSSLGVGIGFEPVASTAEAIKACAAKDHDSLRRILYQASDKLSVLATGTEPMLETAGTIAQFEEILNMVMASYPIVVVDLSGAVPAVKKAVLTRAHEIVIVTTPTLASLRAARALMMETKKIHGGHGANIDLVVNMAGLAAGKEVARADIKTALEVDPQIVINFDPKLFIGLENEGRRLSSDKAGQEVVDKLLPLVQKFVSRESSQAEAEAGDGLLGSLLGKLKTKK
jgi:pilus assembly protein CpaE